MNTFTGHRRWGSVIAWGLNISFIQDGTANTRLYYTKIVANLAPFLCSIISVFGENLKHVIQIPCKDFEGMRWLELMYVRLPAPRHSCTCWTGHGTQKLGQPSSALEEMSPLTCHELSNSHQVKVREDHFQSETDRIHSHWDSQWDSVSLNHRTQNYKPYRKANRCSTEISGMAGNAWEDKWGGPYKQALKKFTFKRIMKRMLHKMRLS